MVNPIIVKSSGGPRFLFNLDANVGPGCPNRPDDVAFVQLGYYAVLRDPTNATKMSAADRSAFAKIVPGAAYTGSAEDPLTRAISVHETSRGGTRDGHVSVARGSGFYDAAHTFIVVALNNALRDTLKGDYPRIDKHPQCPAVLRSTVVKILTGQ